MTDMMIRLSNTGGLFFGCYTKQVNLAVLDRMTEIIPLNCMNIIEAPVSSLAEMAAISIAFTARTVYKVEEYQTNSKQFNLIEDYLDVPVRKDYDSLAGNKPMDWMQQFDLSNWGLFFAIEDGHKIGGALVAFNTPGIDMLEERNDLAVLWDIRIKEEYRGRGIGKELFYKVMDWAVQKGCRELKIETQNNNPTAVKFYQSMGCHLSKVFYNAYPECPDEHMLLFYLKLK